MMPTRLQHLALRAARYALPLRIRGIPRALYITAPFVLGRALQMRRTVWDFWLSSDPGDYFNVMMLYGRYSPEIIGLFQRLLRPGDCALDIGAQLGYISAHLARIVTPSGAVYSLEPDPNVFARLRETVEQNHFHWVHLLPYAAGDRRGSLTFYLSKVAGWSTAVPGSHRSELTATQVECMPIDELVREGQIQRRVRLVKIDVEGHECAVLDGMKSLLERDRPMVLMEVNPDMMAPLGLSPADQLRRIEQFHYRMYTVHEAKGLLAGGTPELRRLVQPKPSEFCDVLAVPAEQSLPSSLRVIGD